MNNISEHISFSEATRTSTGLPNIPNEQQIENMQLVAEMVFEKVRRYISDPITIDSMFRSQAVNKNVGGAVNSQHCTGEAIDMKAMPNASYTNADLFHFIKDKLTFDQLIWEHGNDRNPAWVHVSYSRKQNRNKVLKAITKNGKTIYLPYE